MKRNPVRTLLGNEENLFCLPFFHTRCFAWPTRKNKNSTAIRHHYAQRCDRPSWLLWPPKWTEVWMITGGIQASLSMGIVWLVGMLKLNDANIRDAFGNDSVLQKAHLKGITMGKRALPGNIKNKKNHPILPFQQHDKLFWEKKSFISWFTW